MKHSSHIVVQKQNQLFLQLDCYNESNRLINSFLLLEVFQHEIELNHGRFEHFSENVPANKIFLRHDKRKDIPLNEWFHSIISWISNNTKSHWSFDGKMLDDHRMEFQFGFENVTVCFAFAMVWV